MADQNRHAPRVINTVYFVGKKAVKTNASIHPENAAPSCVRHMEANTYAATHAEVFNTETGQLHLVVRRHFGSNSITIVYKLHQLTERGEL